MHVWTLVCICRPELLRSSPRGRWNGEVARRRAQREPKARDARPSRCPPITALMGHRHQPPGSLACSKTGEYRVPPLQPRYKNSPRPRVRSAPIWTLFIASEFSSACASVLRHQNSTPWCDEEEKRRRDPKQQATRPSFGKGAERPGDDCGEARRLATGNWRGPAPTDTHTIRADKTCCLHDHWVFHEPQVEHEGRIRTAAQLPAPPTQPG